jgi:hypothetical protein
LLVLFVERCGAQRRRSLGRDFTRLGFAASPKDSVMHGWLAALLVTLAIEVPIVATLFPGQRIRMAIVALVVNIATNLALNLVLPRIPILSGRYVFPGEMLAVVGEAAAYTAFSRPPDLPQSLLASALANALSFAAGLRWLPFVLLR